MFPILRRFISKSFFVNTYRSAFSTSKRDLYEILGIQKSATPSQIKSAYYQLAQKYHPDKNPSANAKQRFTEVKKQTLGQLYKKSAYETLINKQKREKYDRSGEQEDFAASSSSTRSSEDFSSYFKNFFRTSDFWGVNQGVFDNIFGSRIRPNSRGGDIAIEVSISFLESVNGTFRSVEIDKMHQCETCEGTQLKPGSKPEKCPRCGGAGVHHFRQGPLQMSQNCNLCFGQGQLNLTPCNMMDEGILMEGEDCGGMGLVRKQVTEQFYIPKGIASGQSIRFRERGHESQDGEETGDLIVQVRVQKDPYFERSGFDVITKAYITVAQAVLGDEISVKTLDGAQKISIKAGTQHNAKIQLKSKGISMFPSERNLKGDQIIHINVKIPGKLTEKQRQLFKQLRNVAQN